MSARRIAVVNYSLAVVASVATYLIMLGDAYGSSHWAHVLTLTPLLPYLVAAGLAFRHRERRGFGVVILILIVLCAASGLPLFWKYYLPHDVRPALKVMTKIILPVCQGGVVMLAGAAMEVALAGPPHGDRDSVHLTSATPSAAPAVSRRAGSSH